MKRYEQMYNKLSKILGKDAKDFDGYVKLKSKGFMDLSIELLYETEEYKVLAMAHYYKQNGDLVADPDMEIRVYKGYKAIEALAYQDSFGYRKVYHEGNKVDLQAKKDLNSFLNQWLKNIVNQGFKCNSEKVEVQ